MSIGAALALTAALADVSVGAASAAPTDAYLYANVGSAFRAAALAAAAAA